MPTFEYLALATDGRSRSGRVDADDAIAAQRAIEAQGLVPTEVKPASTGGMLGSRVPTAQVLAFARSLFETVPLGSQVIVTDRKVSPGFRIVPDMFMPGQPLDLVPGDFSVTVTLAPGPS